ncbi:Succinyl-CoA--L-malate CoA-transferase beta subunit [Fusarium oxysporum f. sp. cubense]|uniref:Succinyl-CoA--L-malate CoA-transferase beta subunit n=1 Tax=Fusarium oxysporum f. sp. cubense TaxID=61366 RepID=A0A559KX11_FUSOC|nr:Succinyl-CoA--L-malate CoA-transferase beta subunit [Fusarium oxysporum f. sp. cubense]
MAKQTSQYTIQAEARRIFEKIVLDQRLQLPEEARAFASKVNFEGDETQPFYPTPFKCAETQAALLGYLGTFAAAISKSRYGLDQEVSIDVAQALLAGLGALFMRCEDAWLTSSDKMVAAVKRWDHGQTRELYRQLATNIYKTKDNRWYSLHGNMDPTPLLTMLDVPQHDDQNRSWGQILDMYMNIVAQFDSKDLDNLSNNVYRVPGTICYEKEEFEALPHGIAIKDEPWYNLEKVPYYNQGPTPWPYSLDQQPLSGIKILELARAIAAPTIGRVCAALGATVIRVSSETNTELPITLIDGCVGKISIDINLKTFEGRKKLMDLIQDADVFVDGYRPAVLEHLGFGRDAVLGLVSQRDRGLIYCQENCYGWKGPWVTRPGWAQIADTVTGIGLAIGRFNGFDEAHIFPGPNADYLTGHAGAAGVIHALWRRSQEGGSYSVNCSLVVSDLHMLSYGQYDDAQIEALKKRNPELVGHMRHYDGIVSHGRNRHCVRGFIADRTHDKALPKHYYQTLSGEGWGLPDIEVVRLPIVLSKTSTAFPIGAYPPGYHAPDWEATPNHAFKPIPAYKPSA